MILDEQHLLDGFLGGFHESCDRKQQTSRTDLPILDFDKSIVDFPNIKRFPGGASNDMSPNLQDPANPVPLMDVHKVVKSIGLGD
jgi:hypothetical protein